MTIDELIKKWSQATDLNGKLLIQICVNWGKIPVSSTIIQLRGKKAWDKIYNFTPPWYEPENRKPFKVFISENGHNYKSEIKMEKEKSDFNKFDYIKNTGLKNHLPPKFIAFADLTGVNGVLADGNHRFLVADYLKSSKKANLDSDIDLTELDVICLKNFVEVIPFDPF